MEQTVPTDDVVSETLKETVLKVLQGGPHTARALAWAISATVPEVHRALREIGATLSGATPDNDRGIWSHPGTANAPLGALLPLWGPREAPGPPAEKGGRRLGGDPERPLRRREQSGSTVVNTVPGGIVTAEPVNLRARAKRVVETAQSKDADGRVYLRVSAPWEAEVYDRRSDRPRLNVGDLFRLDVADMSIVGVGYLNHAYIPGHSLEEAASWGRKWVANWNRVLHILQNNTSAQGPDSFATAGVDGNYATEILAVLLARGVVSVKLVAGIYQEIQEADETDSGFEVMIKQAWG